MTIHFTKKGRSYLEAEDPDKAAKERQAADQAAYDADEGPIKVEEDPDYVSPATKALLDEKERAEKAKRAQVRVTPLAERNHEPLVFKDDQGRKYTDGSFAVDVPEWDEPEPETKNDKGDVVDTNDGGILV